MKRYGMQSGIIFAVIPFAGRKKVPLLLFAMTTVTMFARFACGICKSQNQKSVVDSNPVGHLRQFIKCVI